MNDLITGVDIMHSFFGGKRTMVLAVYILKTECNWVFTHNHHFTKAKEKVSNESTHIEECSLKSHLL